MKQVKKFCCKTIRCLFIAIISVNILMMLPGCKKIFAGEELKFSGNITDDVTGIGISGGGFIRVDGFNANAGGLIGNERKPNIGNGKINANGSFTVSFTKWKDATTYEFYFFYPNNGYINNGSTYLNTLLVSSSYFSGSSYTMNIAAAKMTELKIDFRNVSSFNNDDSLQISFPQAANDILFGYLMRRWENLQNCTVGPFSGIKGGLNASGTLRCNVPCDRKFKIEWLTKKNGVTRTNSDSLSCPRNITTIYSLNY